MGVTMNSRNPSITTNYGEKSLCTSIHRLQYHATSLLVCETEAENSRGKQNIVEIKSNGTPMHRNVDDDTIKEKGEEEKLLSLQREKEKLAFEEGRKKLALLGYSTYLSRQSVLIKNCMKRVFDTSLQPQENEIND